jgi:predicted MFS family arabinose efflux permease
MTENTDALAKIGANLPAADLKPMQTQRVPWKIWYALAILAAANIFAGMDRVSISILMEPIKHELILSDRQLGLMSGLAFALFYALFGLPLAWLADRSSRVRLIAWCLALWSMMTALSGTAQNYSQLFLARTGVGIGEAGCIPPAHSLIGDYFSREKRALALSLFNSGAAIGAACGLFVVGSLAQSLGWRAALQIVGLFGLPLALLTILTLREPQRPRSNTSTKETAFRSISALLSRPTYVHIVIAFSLGQVSAHGFAQWEPAFLMRSFNMRLPEIGAWLGGISVGCGAVGVLAGGFLTSSLMRRNFRWELWIPAGALAIAAPCLLGVVLSRAPWQALLMIGVIHFLAGVAAVAVSAVQSVAEPHRRATAVAMVMLLGSVTGGMGSYLIGLTSDLLLPMLGKESLRYAFLSVSAILLFASVNYLFASRAYAKSTMKPAA